MSAALASAGVGQEPERVQRTPDVETGPWRAVRSGDGVQATAFGAEVVVPTRDRRSVSSWNAGFASAPGTAGFEPLGAFYFWRHPDDDHLFRAVVAGVYDELFYAQRLHGDVEGVLTFSNDTLPGASHETVDGELLHQEELVWGSVRGGAGLGVRRRIGPENDNMLAADVVVEPGLLYFGRGPGTSPLYLVPDSTFELRTRVQVRLDLLQRNLLEMAHAGWCCGADVVHGYRAQSDRYGLPGVETHGGEAGRDSVRVSAYAFGIVDAPWSADERQRLCGSLHVGIGDDLDRFSAPRVGGGADLRGDEWDSTARPLLPGAAVGEFFPEHYAVAALGWRRELTWYAHLDLGGTAAWLDVDRLTAGGRRRTDESLTALSARLSSGCFGGLRLQLGYAYGFDVRRDGDRGGHELFFLVTQRF